MAKILYIIHGYPPQQNAGAEWMAKEINDWLEAGGHFVGIHTAPFIPENFIEYDLIITHLDRSQAVTELCQSHGIPCINIVHHNWEIPHLRRLYDNVGIVYNSEWVAKDRNYPHRSVVVRPPVNPARFANVEYNPKGYITLVNCNADKGAYVFQNIARSCPDLKFLGVKGHHGLQIDLRGKNITQWECQDDIRKVFEQTSILLIPSVYESYGRIGIEAMACGIPVVASDTPGLRESLGEYGYFASRDFIPSWLQHIRSINPNKFVGIKTGVKKSRAAHLWERSKVELQQLEDMIKYMINIKK